MHYRDTTSQPLIELSGVTKVYKTPAGDFLALKDIDLSFNQGEFTSIIGKSGSGKSTFINMITGIDHPTKGSVCVEGKEIHRMKEGHLASWRGRSLGIIFQFFQLLPTLSILENTMLPMDFCDVYAPSEREKKALSLLKLVGLEDVAHKQPAALSGGQQQIAALARALANDPPILIADEPTGNLDSKTAEHILAIFEELASQGKTILIVTHDPALTQKTNRQILISDGEIINESIAKALHHLPHPQLLKLTHLTSLKEFQREVPLSVDNDGAIGLCIVRNGELEIRQRQASGKEVVIGHIKSGEAISALELEQTGEQNYSLKVSSSSPLNAWWMDPKSFQQWLSQSPEAHHGILRAASERSARHAEHLPWLAEKGN
jgi:ABC-type lipoprotein export system ATPase subunit